MVVPVGTQKLEPDARESLLDDIEVIVWEAGPEGNPFTYVNQTAERMLGYPAGRWLERDFWANNIVHPDDRDRAMAECSTATERRDDHVIEYRALAADGRTVWLRDLVRLVFAPDGTLARIRGVLVDVTPYKTSE